MKPRRCGILCLLKIVCGKVLLAQGSGGQPVRYQAQYTRLYFDDVERIGPSVGPGFTLDSAGAITSSSSEVLSGNHSIKGAYSGSGSHTPYLRTLPTKIPLSAGQTYEVSFRYRILVTPDRGFEVLFFSPTGANVGSFLPSVTVQGSAGTSGTATLTNTLGPFNDYEARWNLLGIGAIAIDEIQIVRLPSRELVVSENAEQQLPSLGAGLQLLNGASVTAESAVVLAGRASIRLKNFGTVATNPAVVQLLGNTTYIVEFQYHILTYGSPAINGGDDSVVFIWMQPADSVDVKQQVVASKILKNASPTGTFSAGAQIAGATSYVLNIAALAGCELVIDDMRVLRQDSMLTSSQPSSWRNLSTLPFPRLGRYILGSTLWTDRPGAEPFKESVNQIESRGVC